VLRLPTSDFGHSGYDFSGHAEAFGDVVSRHVVCDESSCEKAVEAFCTRKFEQLREQNVRPFEFVGVVAARLGFEGGEVPNKRLDLSWIIG
jgi:hypothetical protein